MIRAVDAVCCGCPGVRHGLPPRALHVVGPGSHPQEVVVSRDRSLGIYMHPLPAAAPSPKEGTGGAVQAHGQQVPGKCSEIL